MLETLNFIFCPSYKPDPPLLSVTLHVAETPPPPPEVYVTVNGHCIAVPAAIASLKPSAGPCQTFKLYVTSPFSPLVSSVKAGKAPPPY